MRKLGTYFFISTAAALLTQAGQAMAVTVLTPGAPITTADDTVAAVCAGIKWFLAVCLLLSIIMSVSAGYDYVTSQGNEGETKKARMKLTYSVIGAMASLVALGVPQIAADFLGLGNIKACGIF